MGTTQTPPAGFTLLRLTDRVDGRSGRLEAATLRAAIADAVGNGQLHVALDFTPVKLMDAEALGELAAAFSRLKRLGGRLALMEPQERVKRLLAVTRLDTVLPLLSGGDAPAAGRFGREHRSAPELPSWPLLSVC